MSLEDVKDYWLISLQAKIDQATQQVILMHLGYVSDLHRLKAGIELEGDPKIKQYDELNRFLFMQKGIQEIVKEIHLAVLELPDIGENLFNAQRKVDDLLKSYEKKEEE